MKSISRPVIDRLPVNQLDDFACRQLDRVRIFPSSPVPPHPHVFCTSTLRLLFLLRTFVLCGRGHLATATPRAVREAGDTPTVFRCY